MNQSRQDGAGIWNGWYWRFVGTTAVVFAVLEVIAFYISKGSYTFIASGELAMFITAILIVQRVKNFRAKNTLLGVVLSFVINIIFQLTLGYGQTVHLGWANFAEQNLIIGGIGVVFSIVYSRTTAWSDKRRAEMDAKRRERQKGAASDDETPSARVHRVKKKQGRGKRR